MTWDNVRLEPNNGAVHVSQQWQLVEETGLQMGVTKTLASTRTVEITNDVVEVLSIMERVNEYVFASPKSKIPYHPAHVTKAFLKLERDAGFPQLRFHDLRHTHASHLLDAGVPLPEVQRRLGHTLPSTTANIYVHPIASNHRRAAEAFASRMRR